MKQILKTIISFAAYHLCLWHLIYWLFPIIQNKKILYVLMFHRVAPREKTKRFVSRYNSGQDVAEYELTLSQLSKYFEFLSLKEFTAVVSGQRQLKKNSLLITFDDADFDFYEYALPILKNNRWPAVMFTPTDFIETENRFWHLTITNMIQNLDDNIWQQLRHHQDMFCDKINNMINKYESYDHSLKLPLCRKLLSIMDDMNVGEIKDTINQFEKIFKPEDVLGIKCMNWEQLKRIDENNIEVESHTVSHWKMTQIDKEKQKEELVDSRKILDNKLDKKVTAFCYPSGAFNDQIASLAKESGYLVAFTTETGRCRYPLTGIESMKIPRVALGGSNKYDLNYEIGRLII